MLAVSAQAPAGLRAALEKKGLKVVRVDTPATVMLELARGVATAVLLVEPERWAQRDDLLGALRTYHPKVACWWYRRGDGETAGLGWFTRDGQEAGLGTEPSEADTDAPGRVRPPSQRVRPALAKTREQSDQPAPLISEEELAMLLGPLDEEPTNGRAHHGKEADRGES